jgi:hypothetical protein
MKLGMLQQLLKDISTTEFVTGECDSFFVIPSLPLYMLFKARI